MLSSMSDKAFIVLTLQKNSQVLLTLLVLNLALDIVDGV